MNKKEIINEIDLEYDRFINSMRELNEIDFEAKSKGKWSAKQQLEHIISCIKPLVQVYGMPKSLIEETFGKVNRPIKSYQELLDEYLKKLSEGGKAPSQFVPGEENTLNKDQLIQLLKSLIDKLTIRINLFEEAELESLLIPHPLLGKITLKEMLYNAIYHVQHHKKQTVDNLKNQS